MPRKVYHKSIAEMRRGPAIHPSSIMYTTTCIPPPVCNAAPVCNTVSCNEPVIYPSQQPCMVKRCSTIECVHAPYCCPQYRNMSFWCEYCMSRYMFPEHYRTTCHQVVPSYTPAYHHTQIVCPPPNPPQRCYAPSFDRCSNL